MTPEEIEYNKRCAEFLGCKKRYSQLYHLGTNVIYIIPSLQEEKYENCLFFHSDWNWIMEVVKKILSISNESEQWERFDTIIDGIPNEKAVVKAINEFLIWYESKTN